MSKALKILLWLVLGFFLLVLILLVVAYFVVTSAGFQKSVANKVLNQPGTQGRVEYIKIGLSKGEIRGFNFFDQQRQGMTFDKLAFDYDLGALRNNEVVVNRMELSGLLVDLSQATVSAQGTVEAQVRIGGSSPAQPTGNQPSPTPSGGQSAPSPQPAGNTATTGSPPAPRYVGILRSTELAGITYRLTNIAMDGIILLPDNLEIRFKASGEGIAPGQSGTLAAEFTLTDKKPNAPVNQITGSGTITLSQKGTPGFDGIEATFDLAGEGTALAHPAALKFTLAILATPTGERSEIALFTGGASTPVVSVVASMDADSSTQNGTYVIQTKTTDYAFIPGLDTLPALKLDSKGSFTFDNRQQSASLTGDFIVETADSARTPWPHVRGSLTATHTNEEGLTGKMPIAIRGASGISDIGLSFTAKDQSGAASGRYLTLVLFSKHLFVDDLLAMAQQFRQPAPVASASAQASSPNKDAGAPADQPAASQVPPAPTPATASAPAPALSSVPPDLIPVWNGLAGKLTFALEQLHFQGRTLRELNGEITVEGNAISSPKLSAKYQDVTANALGELRFIPGAQKPYLLTGEAAILGIDIGALLRAENPGEQPLIEGVADASASFRADAPQLPYLQDTLRGDVRFTTGAGTLYPIAAGGSRATTTANLASNLLGGALGNAIPGANKATKIIDYLQTVPFDKAELIARRDDELTVFLDSVLIQSPALRFSGSGSLQSVAGTPINEQPLTARLTLSVAPRTDAAKLFSEAHLLTTRTDAAGYLQGPTFQVSGTASDPKTNLTDILLKAGMGAALEALSK